jgi:hypothetical protein
MVRESSNSPEHLAEWARLEGFERDEAHRLVAQRFPELTGWRVYRLIRDAWRPARSVTSL